MKKSLVANVIVVQLQEWLRVYIIVEKMSQLQMHWLHFGGFLLMHMSIKNVMVPMVGPLIKSRQDEVLNALPYSRRVKQYISIMLKFQVLWPLFVLSYLKQKHPNSANKHCDSKSFWFHCALIFFLKYKLLQNCIQVESLFWISKKLVMTF